MTRSPLFAWSPRPDQHQQATPVSQATSRFAAFRLPRTIFNGSSVYSQSPALENGTSPKVPFLGLWQRQQSPNSSTLPTSHDWRQSSDSRLSFHAHHCAGSYIDSIESLQDPSEPQLVYSRHPADAPLSYEQESHVGSEMQESPEGVDRQRHGRKHRRRRRTRRNKQFVRRRDEQSTSIVSVSVRSAAARGKRFACMISATFLLTVLAIYLAIALTNRNLGQEVHILFIMILLAITIFFCHSLIRLCMLLLNPPRQSYRRPRFPSRTNSNAFKPTVPIRVHLARDHEPTSPTDLTNPTELTNSPIEPPTPHHHTIPPPPPAYGLWRSSVCADPNLLHWQPALYSPQPYTACPSPINPTPPVLRSPTQRPPSYVSEDGVSYIVDAAPRSGSGAGHGSWDEEALVHPAWRVG